MQLTSVKPPSVHVEEKLGSQLTALRATLVDAPDAESVEVRFADPKTTTVANAAFEGAVDGIKLLFRDANGKGVRGIADGYAVLEEVSKLPGVTGTMAMETSPLQLVVKTSSAEARAAVDALLRPKTAHGDSIRVS